MVAGAANVTFGLAGILHGHHHQNSWTLAPEPEAKDSRFRGCIRNKPTLI
jgi:hypothetical protein